MPRFQPFPKVKALSFVKKMEPADLHTFMANFSAMEQRLNALQLQNGELFRQLEQQTALASPGPSGGYQNDLFKVPDPLKSIPLFDGNKMHLASWIATAKKTLSMYQPIVSTAVYAMYEQIVINKVEGKARDSLCVNGNPTSFDEVIEVLNATFGDKKDMATYQTMLWSMKMDSSIHLYYKRTKEIAHDMKCLARKKDLYCNHWQAINDFIDQECLAAFIKGLNKEYFGYVQAAKPEDLESAYSFLCKFQNLEHTNKILAPRAETKISYQKQFDPSSKNRNTNAFTNTIRKPNSSEKLNSSRQKHTPMEVDTTRTGVKLFTHTSEDTEQHYDNGVNFQEVFAPLPQR